jgi:hypothetical protein
VDLLIRMTLCLCVISLLILILIIIILYQNYLKVNIIFEKTLNDLYKTRMAKRHAAIITESSLEYLLAIIIFIFYNKLVFVLILIKQ